MTQPSSIILLPIAAPQWQKPTELGEGTACGARRTSAHSFKLRRVCARMCRATNGEPRAMYCGAALRVSSGNGSFAFLLQAFSFSNKKKMPKRGKCEKLDYSGTRRQSANPASSYRAAIAAAVRRVAAHYTSCAPINSCRFRGQMISAPTAHFFTIHFAGG